MARFDERGIPMLELDTRSLAAVDKTRQAAADGEPELLVGETVLLENSRPAIGPGHTGPPPSADVTVVTVGGETLDEALKSIIATYDTHHSGAFGDPAEFDPPEWVASTHAELAKYLAEHYTSGDHRCEVRETAEVSA
jgi:hypothetical protein